MQARKGILALICLGAAVAIGYTLASRQQENLGSLVVRAYQVPPERAADLKNHLNSLFWTKEGGDGGAAQVFGNGLVLVRAPLGYQQGVQTVVDKLASQPPEARQRVRLDYYLLLAQNGKSGTGGSEASGELAPVVESIKKLDGASHVRVLEHMVTTSLTGEEAAAEGAMLKALASTSVSQGQLLVKVALDSWFGKIKTNVELQPGEFLILGENAQRPDDNRTKSFGDGTVYYIIRAELKK